MNVIVHRLGSIGDMVIAIPALGQIRSRHPDSRIILLTNRPAHEKAAPAASVLLGTPYVDEIVSYQLGERSPLKILPLAYRLRSMHCDTAYYLVSEPKNRVQRDQRFLKLAGARMIFGTDPVSDSPAPSGEFASEAAMLLQRAGGPVLDRTELQHQASLHLTQAEQARATALLDTRWSNQAFLGFSVGSKCDVKDWGDANWRQVFEGFSQLHAGFPLVAFGTESERGRTDELLKSWHGPSLNLCGRTSPREAAAVLERGLFFLGHDSGPMHLAAAVGLRCVVVFSARSVPGRWFPFGRGHRILYRTPDCMGCGLEVCDEKRKSCITSISPAEVLAAAKQLHSELRSTECPR